MLNLLLAFILIILLLFIIVQTVSVRITYTHEVIIDIDFTLFALVLYPSRNKKQTKRNKSGYQNRIRNNFIKAHAIKRGLEFLFRRSRVTVHDINVPERSLDPAKIAVRSQNKSSLVLIFLTYLSLKSDSLVAEDDSFVYLEKSDAEKRPLIDLTLISSFFNTVIALSIILLEIKKRKRRQVRKIV